MSRSWNDWLLHMIYGLNFQSFPHLFVQAASATAFYTYMWGFFLINILHEH